MKYFKNLKKEKYRFKMVGIEENFDVNEPKIFDYRKDSEYSATIGIREHPSIQTIK